MLGRPPYSALVFKFFSSPLPVPLPHSPSLPPSPPLFLSPFCLPVSLSCPPPSPPVLSLSFSHSISLFLSVTLSRVFARPLSGSSQPARSLGWQVCSRRAHTCSHPQRLSGDCASAARASRRRPAEPVLGRGLPVLVCTRNRQDRAPRACTEIGEHLQNLTDNTKT